MPTERGGCIIVHVINSYRNLPSLFTDTNPSSVFVSAWDNGTLNKTLRLSNPEKEDRGQSRSRGTPGI